MGKPLLTLVVGATGLLGPYLVKSANLLGKAIGAARRSAEVEMDVTDRAQVSRALETVRPDVVIHAAAMADVDECERRPEAAFAINHAGTEMLLASMPEGARMVYISTDQVYPDVPGDHSEENAAPLNVYGRSKLAGERAALKRPGTLALRTNIFGPSMTPGRSSLSDFVIRSLSEEKSIVLFDDILFSPLHMETLGNLLLECLDRSLSGCYNAGSRQGMSKADFAMAVASRNALSTKTARRGTSRQSNERAPRPMDMRMDVRRIERALGRSMPTLAEEIERL